MKRLANAALIVAAVLAAPVAVKAQELELSFYLGIQEAPHSDVSGDIDGFDFDFGMAWEGRSFEAPPYYGFRLTQWRDERTGFALEFNHAKVYGDDDELDDQGFDRLEFTDGLNILTVNYMRRFPDAPLGGFTPYTGAGIGLSIPHVDVKRGDSKTFEYQITGPAVTWIAGASYPFNDTWAGFVEYKGTYSQNEADLDGGGTLETDIITNALNFGVSYNF
ncbi:MAG: outer membrane beta-barrel protein [Pseudomonadota bacterium]